MIGFYDYTVILTYISFISAVAGIFSASTMNLRWAIFFLALSGLCDMFDGKIARTKKNRTEDEKSFGIQIDSLCDIVCFGVLPIVICFKLGMDRIWSMAILALYGLAGLIRLGYFNVMEAKRQAEEGGARKYYQGLPIISQPYGFCGGAAYRGGAGGFSFYPEFPAPQALRQGSTPDRGCGGSGSDGDSLCLARLAEPDQGESVKEVSYGSGG